MPQVSNRCLFITQSSQGLISIHSNINISIILNTHATMSSPAVIFILTGTSGGICLAITQDLIRASYPFAGINTGREVTAPAANFSKPSCPNHHISKPSNPKISSRPQFRHQRPLARGIGEHPAIPRSRPQRRHARYDGAQIHSGWYRNYLRCELPG
jgi:hypothetical protein